MDTELAELQTRLTFQEDAIDKLSRSLVRQQQQLDRQRRQIGLLQQQIQDLMGPHGLNPVDEKPPPHY